jgi:hypothetical protein
LKKVFGLSQIFLGPLQSFVKFAWKVFPDVVDRHTSIRLKFLGLFGLQVPNTVSKVPHEHVEEAAGKSFHEHERGF